MSAVKSFTWVLSVPGLVLAVACSHQPSGPEPLPPAVPAFPQSHQAGGEHFAVATQTRGSTEAAVEILRKGGNAIDAALAASFAVSVTRPHSSGLGGGGFLLYYSAKTREVVSVDFRERAPQKARVDMFLDAQKNVVPDLSTKGSLAVAVPGWVPGVLDIHKRYGKLPLKTILEPAIRLAEEGFSVYPELESAIENKKELLARFPSSKRIFFKGEQPLTTTDILFQKDLAQTLRLLAQGDALKAYREKIVPVMAQSLAAHQGFVTAQDMRDYQVKWRKPVKGTYKGYTIYSMPPPSSGGVHVLQILNMLEKDDLARKIYGSSEGVHLTTQAMQQAFADRAKFLGDPDYVRVPVNNLTSKEYAARLRQDFAPNARHDVKAGDPYAKESNQTTHLSVLTEDGDMVVSTQTINGEFGSGLVAEGTGIVLNNEMDDFSSKPGAANMFGAVGGSANEIRPGKRPLSSMSPTIVLKGKEAALGLGSPGGTRIITCVAHTLLNTLEYGMSLRDALSALRYHHQWSPDRLEVEPPSFPGDLTESLKTLGYELTEKSSACRVQVVAKRQLLPSGSGSASQKAPKLEAASDPRGEGSAIAE